MEMAEVEAPAVILATAMFARLSFKPSSTDLLTEVPRRRTSHGPLGTSGEFPRAIGDRLYRAIGDRIHVLSGTGIARKTKELRWLGRP